MTKLSNVSSIESSPVAVADAQAVPLSPQLSVSGWPVACIALQSSLAYSLVAVALVAHWLMVSWADTSTEIAIMRMKMQVIRFMRSCLLDKKYLCRGYSYTILQFIALKQS